MDTVQHSQAALAPLLAAIENDDLRELVTIIWTVAWKTRGEVIAERLGLAEWPDGEPSTVREAADKRPALSLVPAPVTE